MSDQTKPLIDVQIERMADSQEISVQEAARLFIKGSEHTTDLDNLPKQNHVWIDRGLKYTCENAGHLWHEAWKVRKPSI